MIVRHASAADAAQIARLCSHLGYEVSAIQVSKRLEKLLSDDDNAVFVMEISNDEVVGWVHVHGRHFLEAYPFAEIGGLVVDMNHRRKGIGESLMRKCEEWAREKGYREVRLRSGGYRKDAHAFHERIGYKNVKWQEVFSINVSE